MALLDTLLDRLEAADALDEHQRDLILGAVTGDIDSVLDGHDVAEPERVPDEAAEPQGAWLRSIEVEGFRGIGRRATLELPPGPGLHVICGRNGSGKSSFSEALELLLTDSCSRWADRLKTWQECWQNLHHDGPTRIAAEVALDGHPGTIRLEGEWPRGAAPERRSVDRLQGSESLSERADLGWAAGFDTWRPFLSYNELGTLLEGKRSDLHDTLASVLGLEPLAEAFERLESARKDVRKVPKKATDDLKFLRSRLEELDDERARSALACLPARGAWKLETVEDLLSGTGPQPEGVERLRSLATLRPLRKGALEAAIEGLEEAAAEIDSAREDRDSALALKVADLLDGATSWFEEVAGTNADCPVCGTSEILDEEWRKEARRRAGELRESADRIRRAQQTVKAALSAARRLTSGHLDLTPDDEERVGPPAAELRSAWERFCDVPDDDSPTGWAEHLRATGPPVLETVEALRQAADALRAEQADAWRPVAKLLADWLPEAHRALDAKRNEKDLKAAADWLSVLEEELRNERFEPIKEQAREIWELLRARSNVSLDDLRFTGQRTARRLEMDVSVDGNSGVALGVMSQGELHSLALSLFLPRATRPESPFRYLLIDDPVQAMDPVKVEGLARVLESVAKTHQVVVFSHDDRLSEAVQRLGIEARLQEVHRRPGSIVEVRSHDHPADRLFKDARALVWDEQLPREVRDRVVPGLCRQAIESRAHSVIRERRLGRGEPHRQVEDLLTDSRTFVQTLALALFDDHGRGGDLYAELNRRSRAFGPRAVDVVKACNKGSHGVGVAGDSQFIQTAEKVALGLGRAS